MSKKLEDILGGALAPELLAQLQEAFDQRIEEARLEAEENIREEFARRFMHDKSNLIEAMDRMVTDHVTKHAEDKAAAVAELNEARDKFRAAITESKKAYRARIAETATVSRKFIAEQLAKHIRSLNEQRVALKDKAARLAEDVEAAKAKIAESHAAHVKKIDEFVTRQVTRELDEFQQDKRALVETRVKLVAESKQKLKDTQMKFIREAAKKIDQVVTENLKREIVEIHEDLERHRQNHFGRKIFEAMAAEYMTSYLAEGTEVRKLQKVLESKQAEIASKEAELEAAKTKLAEAAQTTEAIKRKAKLAEAAAERSKIMSELLSAIRGEKRAVMEQMLETTKTENLRAAYNKLLPVVMEHGTRKSAPQGKKALSEERAVEKRTVEVTGNKRANRLFETAQAEVELDNEIERVVSLAGIKNTK